MEGATVFSEVDLSQGYLQITLAEESRHITAFSTPEDGPHIRFKRLIMGACVSGECFHEIIHQVIRDVPNCQNVSDNIWLWSKDMDEHAKPLEQLLQTLEESGLSLKLPKCSFSVPQVNVFVHIVSGRGILSPRINQHCRYALPSSNKVTTKQHGSVCRTFRLLPG